MNNRVGHIVVGFGVLWAPSACTCEAESLGPAIHFGATGFIEDDFDDVEDFERGAFVCDSTSGFIFPVLPDEEGHFAAARYESEVDVDLCAIRYKLASSLASDPGTIEGFSCRAFVDHDVVVFKDTDGEPDEDPEILARFTVPGGAEVPERVRIVSLDIEGGAPIARLEPGEYLFIAVQMSAASDDAALCISSCGAPKPVPEVAWWSNAREPPFDWARLSDFGLETYFQFVLDVRPFDADSETPCPGF